MMAERHPGWINGVDASEARLATGLLVTAQGTGDALDPLRVRSGIKDSAGQPGLVTLGGNKITINPFQAVIGDAARPGNGPFLATMDALKELPLGAAHPSLSRIDLVLAEVTDSGVGFLVSVYAGESSATPHRPTVTNPNSLELAEIWIPPAGTPLKLTDKRRFTAGLNGILPVRDAIDRPPVGNVHQSLFIYRLDTGVLEVRQGAAWVPYRPPRGDDWHEATLQNNWKNFERGYSTPAYTRTDDGWVRIRGLVASVESGAIGKPIFTLPRGYRPPARGLFAASTNPNVYSRVNVETNGTVVATTGSIEWISLDGIAFDTYS
jgi:hypothetical protein